MPLGELTRGKYQPRIDMRQEALEELAISIRNQGVIQPIVVRPLANAAPDAPRYEIIAGERRWRAAQIDALETIPALVKDVPDEAAIAMELGADGVLMNTAIALAREPVRMARAMKLAVESGRLAYLAGRMAQRRYADPSSPLAGMI